MCVEAEMEKYILVSFQLMNPKSNQLNWIELCNL